MKPIPVGTLVACPETNNIGLVVECEFDSGVKLPRSWSQIGQPPYIKIKWSNGKTHWLLDKDVEIISFP